MLLIMSVETVALYTEDVVLLIMSVETVANS